MSKFLLQLESNGHYSEDVAVVERLIKEQNWLHPSDEPIMFNSVKLEDITKENSVDTIPVGSIEFVNKVLNSGYDKGPMKPINIPQNTQYLFLRKTRQLSIRPQPQCELKNEYHQMKRNYQYQHR